MGRQLIRTEVKIRGLHPCPLPELSSCDTSTLQPAHSRDVPVAPIKSHLRVFSATLCSAQNLLDPVFLLYAFSLSSPPSSGLSPRLLPPLPRPASRSALLEPARVHIHLPSPPVYTVRPLREAVLADSGSRDPVAPGASVSTEHIVGAHRALTKLTGNEEAWLMLSRCASFPSGCLHGCDLLGASPPFCPERRLLRDQDVLFPCLCRPSPTRGFSA